MRRLALLLCLALALGAPACAAGWGAGLGPSKPYEGLAELNLAEIIGYFMPWPRENAPALRCCDRLEIYLPREDIAAGSGCAHVFQVTDGEAQEIDAIDFADPTAVRVRKLDASALESLHWGGGMGVTLFLKDSLELDGEYYVLMDAGCLTAPGVSMPAIDDPAWWRPSVSGEFGVEHLRYMDVAAAEGTREERMTRNPVEGNTVMLDIRLGGDAKKAVVFSDNDSVRFTTPQYNASGTAVGQVRQANIRIGVLFLDELGQNVDTVQILR